MLGTTVTLILAAFVYWAWSNNMQFRERAARASSAACRDVDVQLLDQMVALSQWRLIRDARGWFQVQRAYRFEFSRDGSDRLEGRVVFLGTNLEYVCFEQPGRAMIIHDRAGLGGDYRHGTRIEN
ncbi:MAG: DUF3301 domain-containing protein [Gammaproteobacteria bacterium]